MQQQFRQQKEYEKDLCKIIQMIYFYEEKLEKIRISLSESARFNIVFLFFKISRMKNHITKNDFRSFFAVNHQPVIEKECDFLVFNYSSNQSSFLTFDDFLKLFTPKTNQELIQRLQDQYYSYAQGTMILPQYEINQANIPFFIEDISVKLLNLELKFFRELEAQKMYFTNKYGTNILSAFQNISERGHSFDIIHKLFQRCGYTFTMDNFHFLMNRIDRDGNGLISKDEFLDEKFILPSYKFATYSTMMSTQKLNSPVQQTHQYQDYRIPTSGTFKIADNSDQKGQFSFIQRSVQREDGNQILNGYNQVPSQNNQNGVYLGTNEQQYYNQAKNQMEYESPNQQQLAQKEFIYQRMLNYQQQQQQQQQQINQEKSSSLSQKNQQQNNISTDVQGRQKHSNNTLQNAEIQSRQQNSQNVIFQDSQNLGNNPNYINDPNSPINFAINDSLDHVNQIYVNSHSQSNLAVLSQKKI
ncbi:hypothetical protein ABPG72_000459 [Tetrahymena utriculariae]